MNQRQVNEASVALGAYMRAVNAGAARKQRTRIGKQYIEAKNDLRKTRQKLQRHLYRYSNSKRSESTRARYRKEIAALESKLAALRQQLD